MTSRISLISFGLLMMNAACGGDVTIPAEASGQTSAGSTSAGSSGGAPECTSDADCAAGQLCAYAIADACQAKGVCVDHPPISGCNEVSLETGCGCDGSDVHWTGGCQPSEPEGYAPAPIVHQGACSTSG